MALTLFFFIYPRKAGRKVANAGTLRAEQEVVYKAGRSTASLTRAGSSQRLQ